MTEERSDFGRRRRPGGRARGPGAVAPAAPPPPAGAMPPPPASEAAAHSDSPRGNDVPRRSDAPRYDDAPPRNERGDTRAFETGGASAPSRPPGDFRPRDRNFRPNDRNDRRDRGGRRDRRDGRRGGGGGNNGNPRFDRGRPNGGDRNFRRDRTARPPRTDFAPPRPVDPEIYENPAAAVNRSRPIYGDTNTQRGGGWNNRRNDRGGNFRDRGRRGRRDGSANGQRPGAGGGAFDPRVSRGFVQRQRVEDTSLPALPANPREAALRILQAVDTRAAFSDRLLDGAHQRGGPDPRDHALMHELVKGTLRWRGRIDWVLDQLVHIGLSQVQPWIKNVLRLGAYQVLFLDRIPPHAAVDEAVKLAHQYGHPGTAGLANSVLRRLIEQKDSIQLPGGDDAESLAIWGSHPRWIVERWLARFGPEATRALLSADNRIVPVGLRVHRTKLTRSELVERLQREGITARPARWSPDVVWAENASAPGSLDAFKKGLCTAQDESEALVSRLVAPEPHERILDLCAAPGGKCTHLAELMEDEGEVWAMERAEARVESLENTIARLGLHCIHVQLGDGRNYDFPMPFDRVLVDAPCSGLGVLARRADARWRKGPEVLSEMPGLQLELLTAGGRRLRPGGVLVYSVCSFEPEETTQVVDRFLRQNPNFVLESATVADLPEGVVNEAGFLELLPHVHGCDGAFAARFRRT